eukprot:4961211-Pyramimonas_sp.AAC.1
MEATDIIQGRIYPSLAYGNCTADVLAGIAADEARVSTSDRQRLALAEHKAHVVRMRLSRTVLEALEAEKAEFQCSGEPRPRRQKGMVVSKPPAPKLC